MKTMFRKVLLAALLVLLAVLSIVVHALLVPDVSGLVKTNPKSTAFMRHRQAQWAEQGKKVKIRQKWVSLKKISPNLVKAVLIGEDDKFYQHEGFDFEAIGDALERNLEEGRFAAGASTITQQLAKNLFLSPDKSLVRKLREAVLVWRMEQALSKKRILEIYLNVAEWGPGLFGAEAASRRYFGKSASSLTPGEASRLAAVLPNPLRYSPVKRSKYVAYRSKVILRRLLRRIKKPEAPAGEVSQGSNVQIDKALKSPVPVEEIVTGGPQNVEIDDKALLKVFRGEQNESPESVGVDSKTPEAVDSSQDEQAEPASGSVPAQDNSGDTPPELTADPAPTLEEELYRQSLEELTSPSD